MKKIMAFVLALTLTFTLAACGGTGEAGIPSGAEDNSTDETSGQVSLSGEIGGEITISAYDTMQYKAFLEDAAKLFEENYPGTRVNVETFSTMPEIKTSGQGDKKMVVAQMQDDPQ
ncbi:MAG: hypothetical protein E7476_01270, partial [Ruminococcaceae bacterium]|nr:hypothetical protein [Oscillospiraceae bacterium]